MAGSSLGRFGTSSDLATLSACHPNSLAGHFSIWRHVTVRERGDAPSAPEVPPRPSAFFSQKENRETLLHPGRCLESGPTPPPCRWEVHDYGWKDRCKMIGLEQRMTRSHDAVAL